MALLDTLMINFADVGDSVISIDVEFKTESGILLNILILLDHIEARRLINNKSDL